MFNRKVYMKWWRIKNRSRIQKWTDANPERMAYKRAKQRCTNPKHISFYRYGGRGIKFLFTSFAEFFWDIGPRPSKDHSLDRINNDGHYEIGNVRWATYSEQMQNRRKWSRVAIS